MDFCLFPFLGYCQLPYKPCRVIGVSVFRLSLAGRHHFLRPLDLSSSYLFLIGGVFGGVRDNQALVQLLGCIGRVFVENMAGILIIGMISVYRIIICQTFEAFGVQGPFPVFFGKLLNGLGDNEGSFSHMVEFPVRFRPQARVTTVNKFVMTEIG